MNGYTIYAGGRTPDGWVVRVYRDSDDAHVYSYERGSSVRLGLEAAAEAIERDLKRPEEAAQPLAAERS